MGWFLISALLLSLPTAFARSSTTRHHSPYPNTNAPDCIGTKAVSAKCSSKESPMIRDFFYVGGGYVPDSALHSDIYVQQMYVEKLSRPWGYTQPYPIVMITAGVPSGAAWLNTPDNRKGWASYFVERGYLVYIVDIISNGRSTQAQLDIFPLKVATDVTITEEDFTAPQLIDPYPQSVNHTQWPGNGTQYDPYFDAFIAAMVPITSNQTSLELSMRHAGCTLLSMINEKTYLISHSASAVYTILMSDQCPELIKGSINLEPSTTPFQNLIGNATVPAVGSSPARPCGLTNTLITYDPPITNCSDLKTQIIGEDTPSNRSCILQAQLARQLPQIAKVPYLALTGSASPHITYDHCVIAYLNQAGVKTDWIKLGDLGIEGNGHFLYLEKNNLEVAAVVQNWISEQDSI